MQSLPAHPVDGDARVYMAAEYILLCRFFSSIAILRTMTERKRADAQPGLKDLYSYPGIPFSFKDIMVAECQQHSQGVEVAPPLCKEIQLTIGTAVEHIAHHDQTGGLKVLDMHHQPLHVVFEYRLRYSNARLAEMPRFPEMKIGDDQRLFLLPKYRSAGSEAERLPPYTELLECMHDYRQR